eukprot:1671617-Rhodomonas_salina.1
MLCSSPKQTKATPSAHGTLSAVCVGSSHRSWSGRLDPRGERQAARGPWAPAPAPHAACSARGRRIDVRTRSARWKRRRRGR